MSNWWLLFALLSIGSSELIKLVGGIKLEEYREYVTLVSDVQEYFKVSSVFISYPGNDENLETTTLMVHLMQQFSSKDILSMSLNYTAMARRPFQGRIVRPLYVVLLNTMAHVDQFRNISKQCEMSYPFWLLIFIKPRPEVCGAQAEKIYTKNYFHLRFDTEMLVKCYGSATLTEWYALHEDRTSVEELATWDVDTGLTLRSNLNLFERRHNLQGKLIRIATAKESPFLEQQQGFTKADLFSMIFSELKARLNFTVQLMYEEANYGMYNTTTGKWSGLIGRLHVNDVDVGVAKVSITEERLNVVDFTQPIVLTRNRLYMKEPDSFYFQWSTYFQVYGADVWIVTLLLYVFTSLLITLIRIKVNESTLPPDHISENYLSIWGIYCQQGMPNFPTATPMRIAYFSILLSSIILIAIYSACLISYLTLNNPSLPFSDLNGFIRDGSYKLMFLRESADYSFFAMSPNKLIKKMMNLMADPKTLPWTVQDGFKQACSGKVAYFTTEAIKSQANSLIPCPLVFVETGKIVSLGLTLKKNSPYTKLFNFHLQKFRDMGILSRLRSKVHAHVNSVENKYFPVSFEGILSILVILCFGVLLSSVILTAEFVIHRNQMAKQNRRPSFLSTKISRFQTYF